MAVPSRLDYQNIPDDAFFRAIRKRDIVVASPMSMEERRNNPKKGIDIKVRNPLGFNTLVDRNFIVKNYRYLDGTKIKMTAWKSKKKYQIMKSDNTLFYVLLIPNGVEVSALGRQTILPAKRSGAQYLVCFANNDGSINRERFGTCGPGLFKKMFIVLPDARIDAAVRGELPSQRAKRGLGKNERRISGNTPRTEIKQTRPTIEQKAAQAIRQRVNSNTQQQQRNVQRTPETAPMVVQHTTQQNGYVYTAIGRNLNPQGTVSQFVIVRIGYEDNPFVVDTARMVGLCKDKLVDNIMIYTSTDANGVSKSSLRGNGIKISDLPVMNQPQG